MVSAVAKQRKHCPAPGRRQGRRGHRGALAARGPTGQTDQRRRGPGDEWEVAGRAVRSVGTHVTAEEEEERSRAEDEEKAGEGKAMARASGDQMRHSQCCQGRREVERTGGDGGVRAGQSIDAPQRKEH